jgi:K+-sensing histidine kinase KdpD
MKAISLRGLHPARTPLTSIMMAAEMLLEEEEAEDPESTRTNW